MVYSSSHTCQHNYHTNNKNIYVVKCFNAHQAWSYMLTSFNGASHIQKPKKRFFISKENLLYPSLIRLNNRSIKLNHLYIINFKRFNSLREYLLALLGHFYIELKTLSSTPIRDPSVIFGTAGRWRGSELWPCCCFTDIQLQGMFIKPLHKVVKSRSTLHLSVLSHWQ